MPELNLNAAFRSISVGELQAEDRAYLTRILITFFSHLPPDTRAADLLQALKSSVPHESVVSWEEAPLKKIN